MKTLVAAIDGLIGKPEKVVRGTSLGLFKRIVEGTPVKSGRARGNWQITFGSPARDKTGIEDKSGGSTVLAGAREMNNHESGTTIYMTNNLPYAERLEYGWSKQKPSGWVRILITELDQHLKREAGKL